jgi:hypothetical protein
MILETLLTGRIVSYNAKIARICGSVNAGLLLCQLCYWSDKGSQNNFFYKTVEEIDEEIALSSEQTNAINQLKTIGFISVTLRGLPAKRYFTINYSEIEKALSDSEFKASVKISEKQKTSLQTLRTKKAQKLGEKTENKFSVKQPTCSLENREHHIDDFKDDLEKREEREGEKISFEFEDEFLKYASNLQGVKNSLAYSQKLASNLRNGHAVTLQAYDDFVKALKISNSRSFVQTHYDVVSKRVLVCLDVFQISNIFTCADSPYALANVEPYYIGAMCRKEDDNKNALFTFDSELKFLDFLQKQI